MHKNKEILYFLIIFISWCISINSATPHYDPVELYFKTDSSVVIIANKMRNGALLDENFFNYGSLVHQKIVLTLTEVTTNKTSDNLEVYTNCYSDWYIFPKSCNNKVDVLRVRSISYITKNNSSIESKYSLLYLKRKILFNAKLKIATLPKSDDIIDGSNCIIYSYLHHINTRTGSFSSFITPLKASEDKNGFISVKLLKNYHLVGVNNLQLNVERLNPYISFMGSPITCRNRNSTEQVLVAISNLKLESTTRSKFIATIDSPKYNAISLNLLPEEVQEILLIVPPLDASISVINVLF